jgi:hypothetical protein
MTCITCTPSRKFAFLLVNYEYVKRPLIIGMQNARRFAKQLVRMGFICDVHHNLNIVDMQTAYRNFIDKLQPNDIIIIYFSGHSKNIGDAMYNSSITPKCRISVANIFQCIRTKIKTGVCIYIADTCSADKLNCHFADCRPLTHAWVDKYITRDQYNIHNRYETDTKKCKKRRGNVSFVILTSSEPGTVSYDVAKNANKKNISKFTGAVIGYMSKDRMRSRTSVYTIYDFYNDVVHALSDMLQIQQPAILVASAFPLILFCPRC